MSTSAEWPQDPICRESEQVGRADHHRPDTVAGDIAGLSDILERFGAGWRPPRS